MSPKLGQTIVLDFITSGTTGAASDADATPTAEVFEDATDAAVLAPAVVKRAGKAGNYRVTIACTAGNGFEAGKSYNAIATATCDGVAGCKAVIGRWQVADLAEADTPGTTTLLSRLPQAMLFTGSGEAKADFWRAGAQVAAGDPADDAALAAAAVWATSSRTVTGGTIATLTGHTPQTGDAYALIGATGSGLTSLAQAGQIPTNFTSALFASAGVFATGALANAPTGGSGSADFTADQRTSLLAALGVPSSGTTLVVPTSGVLKAINDKTTNLPASPAAVGSAMTVSDKTGFRLAANGLDAIAVEAGVNARQALAPILAAAAGAVTGAGTGTIAIRGANSTVTRITAATDNAGNRTSVALSLPA